MEEKNMKYSFYRPATINTMEMESILEKLQEDLRSIRSGQVSEEAMISYVQKIIEDAKPLAENQSMVFMGFAEPETMPSDSRVRYFYEPTYLAACILLQAKLQGVERVLTLSGFDECFRKMLHGSTGRGFQGAGYDDFRGLLHSLNLFYEAGVLEFLEKFPSYAPSFTRAFQAAQDYLSWRCRKEKVLGSWGEEYTEEAKGLLEKLRGEKKTMRIFVYGTLMKGNRNHDAFLKESTFLGEAVLRDYVLYHLGSYPGIKEEKDSSVKGEVYEVSPETLKRIHLLEGEGELYAYCEVPVWQDGVMLYPVGTYVYLPEVSGMKKVPYAEQPWQPQEELIWYVSYGSNMLFERFRCYLEGGRFRGNGREHTPCSSTRLPARKKAVKLPYSVYYGERSFSWENLGVAFLDTSKPGKAYGVAYLITKTQYLHILREENGGRVPQKDSSWYGYEIMLKEIEGIPAMTFTSKSVRTKNDAGPLYKSVLLEGLIENYPKADKKELEEYVESRNQRT